MVTKSSERAPAKPNRVHVRVCACVYVCGPCRHPVTTEEGREALLRGGCCYYFTALTSLRPSFLICKARMMMFMNQPLGDLQMKKNTGLEEAIL